MRAVITVIGKDTVGILAKVSTICSDYNANIIDVTQTVMQDLFAMIMLVETDRMNTDYCFYPRNEGTWHKSKSFHSRHARGHF